MAELNYNIPSPMTVDFIMILVNHHAGAWGQGVDAEHRESYGAMNKACDKAKAIEALIKSSIETLIKEAH